MVYVVVRSEHAVPWGEVVAVFWNERDAESFADKMEQGQNVYIYEIEEWEVS